MNLLLQRVRQTGGAGKGDFSFLPLGQHGYIFRFGDTLIGCDLFLSPWNGRMVPPLLSYAEALENVKFFTGSHDHDDHIDRGFWLAALKLDPEAEFLLPAAVKRYFGTDEKRFIPIDCGESFEYRGVKISAIPSAHEKLEKNDSGEYSALGLIFEYGNLRIYHSGDCCIYPEIWNYLGTRKFDAVFLPINGRDSARLARNCIGNMSIHEAADLAGSIGAECIIPSHFDMFKDNSADPAELERYMKIKYPEIKVIIPEAGKVRSL